MVAGSSPAGRTIQGSSTQSPKSLNATVAVAQLVEPRIVIPVVAGSIPVSHPIYFEASLFLYLIFISRQNSFLFIHTLFDNTDLAYPSILVVAYSAVPI